MKSDSTPSKPRRNHLGPEGEQLARRYLEERDYLILETNYHVGHLEADIIAYADNRIVFIEVKSRKSVSFGNPEDFVDRKKQQAYIKIANHYMLSHHRDEEARFDIIAIVEQPNQPPKISNIINAFTTVG